MPWHEWTELCHTTPLLLPLPPRVWITARGSDAIRFLNGQSSNQMENLRAEQALRTCLLTNKGKLIAAPWAWLDENRHPVLEVPAALEEAVLARLDRYLVADDVELSSAPAPTGWHLTGPGWPPDLLSQLRAVPRFGRAGHDFPQSDPPASLPPETRTATAEEAELLRLALALPGDENEISAEVFPAEIGLDQTAVDFHKGCYLGQEVVSRLESVGQARRGLLRWTSPAQVPVGTNLSISANDATERTAGTITSTSPAQVGGLFFGLALVRTDLAAPGATLSASQKSGPTLEVTLHSIP